ncbi:OTU protein [Batrachochytrium dendrobatidis]|nr:OTU protein [Batrachochytrium dendrobatidis]
MTDREVAHEALLARHRQENKELIAKTTALKKTIAKGASGKAQKKQVQDQIAQLQNEQAERHSQEIAADTAILDGDIQCESEKVNVALIKDAMDGITLDSKDESVAKFKKGRQAKRKERKAAKWEDMRLEAEAEAANAPNFRAIEQTAMDQVISKMGLTIKQIAPDGHCLYNAIADQLLLVDSQSSWNYRNLRELASTYMLNHRDEFINFLATDDGNVYTNEEFDEYCRKICDEAVWGGQLEIQALSQALQHPIHIVQSGSPTLEIGEKTKNTKPLIVSYHRKAYGLGAHYNSLVEI